MKTPRAYFSFRSPFSWMALERLRKVPEATQRIRFIPYWDPDAQTEQALKDRGGEFHYIQMSKAKHLYILGDTKRLADRLGLRMAWPIDVDPWWEVPHLAWLQARRLGKAGEFYDAVIAARWQRGQDICDRELMRAIGTSIGADPDLLANAVDDPDIRTEAVDGLLAAYNDDVFGVPFFIAGRHRFWGFERLEGFLEALRREAGGSGKAGPGALHDVPPEVALDGDAYDADVPAYDADVPGGCG